VPTTVTAAVALAAVTVAAVAVAAVGMVVMVASDDSVFTSWTLKT